MAVTQQLARIPAAYLAACGRSAAEPQGARRQWDPPAADVLDLDWAPALLQRVCRLAGLDRLHLEALRRATDGDTAIELGFLNTPPHEIGMFGPAPAALSATDVTHVSELLEQIDFQAALAALPTDETEAAALIGHNADEIIGGLRAYLQAHFDALRDFYAEASRRGLLVVLWWD